MATQLYVRAHVAETVHKDGEMEFQKLVIYNCSDQIILSPKTTSDRTLVISYKQDNS